MKLKACIPGLLIILECTLLEKIDFSHCFEILVPQNVHFSLEIHPRESALSLEILEEMLREFEW